MDLTDRLTALEQRLDRIEAALGLSPAARPAPVDEPPPIPVVETIEPPDEYIDPFMAAVDPPAPSPPPFRHASVFQKSRPEKKNTLEETIGLKWAGWVGAIVFVIGAGFFISWLYSSGYFALIPASVRVAAMAVVGLGLIGAGEVVLRKFDPRAAVGLFGAGVAVLLLVGYAGHAFYNLYGQDTALLAMGAATTVGAIAAGRGKMVSIGVLSVLGGALAPIVLNNGTPRPAGFFTYLIALQIVALVLCFRGRDNKWWSLRIVSFAITSLWVFLTIHASIFTLSVASTVFCLISATLYETEVCLSTRRQDRGATGVVFNLIVTGLLVAALLTFSANEPTTARLTWVLSLAAVAAVLAVVCLRSEPLKWHGVGYLIQAAALVAVLAPVALTGHWVAVAWLGWAIALAVAARWFDTPATRPIPSLIWTAAVVDLLLNSIGFFGTANDQTGLIIGSQGVTTTTAIGLVLAAGGLVISSLSTAVSAGPGPIATASMVVWIVAAIGGLSAEVSTVTVAGFAWVLAAFSAFTGRRCFLTLVGATLAVACCQWVGMDLIFARLQPAWRPDSSAALFSASLFESVAIAVSVAGIYLLRRRAVDDYLSPVPAAVTAVAVSAAVVLLLTIGVTVEADRWVVRSVVKAFDGFSTGQWRQLLVTGIWTVGLTVFAIIARIVDRKNPGRSAVVLCGCAVCGMIFATKYLLVDTGSFWLLDRPVPDGTPVNPGSAVAGIFVVVGGLFEWRAARLGSRVGRGYRDAVLAFVMTIAVWSVTLEIDRISTVWSVETGHVITSVFWGTSGVAAVVAGFVLRRAAARYFGLTLLAITSAKVVFVDLSNVQTGWRILSFMALGGLLLLTSVVYGKVSPGRRGPATIGGEP